MRDAVIKIYEYSELSDKAKEVARQADAEANGFVFSEEYIESLKKLALHFNGKLGRYGIDWFNGSHSYASFDMPEMEKEEIEKLLGELGSFNPETLKGNGSCVLTGCGSDEDAIDGFRIAFHGGETDLEKLMQAAFKTWLKAGQSECEAHYSDEGFGETADANDYEFLEDGSRYREKT